MSMTTTQTTPVSNEKKTTPVSISTTLNSGSGSNAETSGVLTFSFHSYNIQ
jgi:hypothetical protein